MRIHQLVEGIGLPGRQRPVEVSRIISEISGRFGEEVKVQVWGEYGTHYVIELNSLADGVDKLVAISGIFEKAGYDVMEITYLEDDDYRKSKTTNNKEIDYSDLHRLANQSKSEMSVLLAKGYDQTDSLLGSSFVQFVLFSEVMDLEETDPDYD